MLLQFFEAMNASAMSVVIRDSLWMVGIINASHLLCVVMFIGAVLMVDLRLVAADSGNPPLAEVARDAHPWLIAALIGLTVTGIPQIMTNALREYHSYLFWMKMTVLCVALIHTFTLRRKVAHAEHGVAPATRRAVGAVSIALWIAVLIPARLIGLFT